MIWPVPRSSTATPSGRRDAVGDGLEVGRHRLAVEQRVLLAQHRRLAAAGQGEEQKKGGDGRNIEGLG
jgi:hypothetical protein